jgi:L-malate glycosyltransferase
MRILMVIPGLPMGGAETFFVRLAKGLARTDQVFVHILSPYGVDPFLISELSGLPITFGPFSNAVVCQYFYKLWYRLDRLLPRLRLGDLMHSWSLRMLHRRHSFAVINPHLLLAERHACLAFAADPVPVIGSDHGDYRWVINEENLLYFEPVFHRSDALIHPSESNLVVRQQYFQSSGFTPYKIYYGYEFQDLPPGALSTAQNGNKEFVFGMVSRGIAEKGWSEALAAFVELSKQVAVPIRLVFVGEGDHLRSLKEAVPGALKDRVEFAGYQSDPRPFITRFTVGLLPTYFKAESLPNVIIEYLAQGKPVIATDTGGIREMVEFAGESAGIIVGKDSLGRADVQQLCAAMKQMICDLPIRERAAAHALRARERFSMQNCVDAYLKAFQHMRAKTNI